jgi:hypothetical protein
MRSGKVTMIPGVGRDKREIIIDARKKSEGEIQNYRRKMQGGLRQGLNTLGKQLDRLPVSVVTQAEKTAPFLRCLRIG